MKTCCTCKTVKQLSEFTKSQLEKNSGRCRECQSNYTRQHYNNNKQAYREKTQNRRELYRERMAKLKDKPCADCGQSFPPFVMDFDHRNPKEKKFMISSAEAVCKPFEEVLLEVNKCDLVCANCHRIRTFTDR